jgi:hypothetical protein
MQRLLIGSIFFLFILSCDQKEEKVVVAQSSVEQMHQLAQSLNNIIVYDIFSPPVASRIYAYASLAAYESNRNQDTSYPSLTAQLNDFGKMPSPQAGKEYDYRISAITAFFSIAKKLTFTKDSTVSVEKEMIDSLSINTTKKVAERSIAYGVSIADSILARASRDHYKQIQGMPRYTISELNGKWKNTPPDYFDGVQPYWNKMRTLVMDSASQFKPTPPPIVSTDKKSSFYKEMQEVFDLSKALNDSTKEVARFWDDNASATTHVGHLTYATKKPSPGGHWINITTIACKQSNFNWVQSAQAYAMTSIAMYDGFISCWDEKYRSEYVRPVTAINEFIDPNWESLLQTPPFPEYTSGHSVVSSSIANVLTKIFGDDFAFTDSYEKPYIGLERSFPSFIKASEEACISRMYGGIHFRSAVVNGKIQGRALGDFINSRIKIK